MDAAAKFNLHQARTAAALPMKMKRRLLQLTRYGVDNFVHDKPHDKPAPFAQGATHMNVFFPHHGLFGAEVLVHHVLKTEKQSSGKIMACPNKDAA